MEHPVAMKAAQVLKIVMIFCLFIAARVWQLAWIQHEAYAKAARRPLEKIVYEKPPRGVIMDRAGIPLALNRVQYDIALTYQPVRALPQATERRAYVEALAEKLAKELGLNFLDVEDFIYSRAAPFPDAQITLKADVTEKEFFRCKALEKDWPGLVAVRSPKRFYPKGKSGAHLLGYLSNIDAATYRNFVSESKELATFMSRHLAGEIAPLPRGYACVKDVQKRLRELQEMSYQMDDLIGQEGLEKSFERLLRGHLGKNIFLIDTLDQKKHALPQGQPPLSGACLQLTLSQELQEYAESLLGENEVIRSALFAQEGKYGDAFEAPWILGGAIVAMIPKTGEVVACASYPRFDPNDFVSHPGRMCQRWLESPPFIGAIWDGKEFLEKEIYNNHRWISVFEPLTWSRYLQAIINKKNPLYAILLSVQTMGQAWDILDRCHFLLDLSEQSGYRELLDVLYEGGVNSKIREALDQHQEALREERRVLDPYFAKIRNVHDRLLFIDCLQLVLGPASFSRPLRQAIALMPLAAYREYTQAAAVLEEAIEESVKAMFHTHDFLAWRQANFVPYLKEKRQAEKKKKSYERPYLDYLIDKEREEFQNFFHAHRLLFMEALIFKEELQNPYFPILKTLENHPALQKLQKICLELPHHLAEEFLMTLTPFKRLTLPLVGDYPKLPGKTLQDLARAFYPQGGFGHVLSRAYRTHAPLGSIFKIITGFEALQEHFAKYDFHPPDPNPLTIIDASGTGTVLGFTDTGQPITRNYKGGRLPKSAASIGQVDFFTAMERSSNIYYSLLASEIITDPRNLIATCYALGLGDKTGLDLPGEAKGFIPSDICEDKSALYAFAIGQHRLLTTPLQATVALATLASDGERPTPHLVDTLRMERGKQEEKQIKLMSYLHHVGIHFPLFAPQDKSMVWSLDAAPSPAASLEVRREVKDYLFETLKRVVIGEKGTARAGRIQYLNQHPESRVPYTETMPFMIGKTSTAEIAYHPTLDAGSSAKICNHIWFGGVSFRLADSFDDPELAVVVFLPYGSYGKEAAPLAALIVHKWREIQAKAL